MKENDIILDDIMSEFGADAPEVPDTPREMPQALCNEKKKTPVVREKKTVRPVVQEKKEDASASGAKKVLSILGKIGLVLLETVLLLAITVYGVMFVLAKGPSPTARDLFVRSVRETSAIGFLANIYFSDEEIAQIESAEDIEEYAETDTSLITIVKPEENAGPVADEWGLIDEDGDGIILEKVTGEGFVG